MSKQTDRNNIGSQTGQTNPKSQVRELKQGLGMGDEGVFCGRLVGVYANRLSFGSSQGCFPVALAAPTHPVLDCWDIGGFP